MVAAHTLWAKQEDSVQKAAAENVINTYMGDDAGLNVKVFIDLEKDAAGRDKFSYQLTGTVLEIHASNGVSACRAFYDFVKSNGAGICSWTGTRFKMPQSPTKIQQSVFTSPYRDHQYFNVVTYGYTTPYWDEARWDKEIDWMALHGVDMPLMLVAAEAIYRRVFTQAPFNLTSKQVDSWEVGAAHLPWFRMGNLAGNSFDGPLGTHWNERQIALAHHILERMRALGMKPVCPAFGGFVPLALAQKYSGQFSYTGWNWVPQTHRNYRLNPDTDAFVEVGIRFIQEWEKEFGECTYYLSDSFNEMTIPEDLNTLTSYGDHVFKCIKDGSSNPNAVWVTQGWTFVYQAGEWGKAKFNALTKNVPKHRFNMLYMSPEYGNGKWNSPYEGFNGHDWTITMLPNMGGKNFYNGGLADYASTWRIQYTSNCDNLTGWGLTPEGVENNEMLYELICDAGWTPINSNFNLSEWKTLYAHNRYGSNSSDIQAFLNMLHTTVLSNYQDHKCFGWQGYNKTNGYINASIDPGEDFHHGMETFLSASNLAQYRENCPELLRYDIIEAAAFYAGCRIEKLNKRIKAANTAGKKDEAHALLENLKSLMLKMDRILTAHPLYDEQKWEEKAIRMAGANNGNLSYRVEADESEAPRYMKNARRIVSLWYGDHSKEANGHEPVNDYACRTWAGLIRDYYLPRLVAEWENVIDNAGHNLRDVENTFICAANLSPVESLETASDATLLDLVTELVEEARIAGDFNFEHVTEIKASTDAESHWYAIRSAGNKFNLRVLTTTPELDADLSAPLTAQDLNGTTSQVWRFIKYGNYYRIENRNGMSMSFNNETNSPVTYLANIDTDIKMILHGKAGVDSKSTSATEDTWGILPMTIPGNTNTGYHMNANRGLMVWNHEVGGKYYEDSSWSIEEVSAIGETYDEDYARYRRRLTGFRPDMYGDNSLIGKVGQPRTPSSITTAIAKLGNFSAGDHETYDSFLRDKWTPIWTETINLPSTSRPKACKLFDLIISAFQMKPSPNEAANNALATALRTAQTTLAQEGLTEAQAGTAYNSLETAIKNFMQEYNVTFQQMGNHQAFLIKNPTEAEGGDGRGTLCLYSGNDNTGTDAPICVDLVKYPSYTHTGWPTSSTASGICTAWAKYTSAQGKVYIYNVGNGRFLSSNSAGRVVFNDVPEALTIKECTGGYQIVGKSGKNLCFTPGWGQSEGYYAIWNTENKSDLCALTPLTAVVVSEDIKAVVEKEVEIAENIGKYIGGYTQTAATAARKKISSKTGSRTAAACESVNEMRNTINPDKYYRIESALNANIAIYQNQDEDNNLRYANHKTYGDQRFIFRFVEAGTETSSNWGESREYKAYKLYCAGAEQKGYVANGTWNSPVRAGNSNEAKTYKLAEVNPTVFMLSAKYDDNCTLSIGNGKTSIGDSEQGNLVSWNIYDRTDLSNTWRIYEATTPTALTLETILIPSSEATTYFFCKDVKIPQNVTAMFPTTASASPMPTVKDGFYNLTYNPVLNIIPAGTAVVLTGKEGTYSFKSTMAPSEYLTESATDVDNMLTGYVSETENTLPNTIYSLIQPMGDAELAFYPYAASCFKAKTAYLDISSLPGLTDAKGFYIFPIEEDTDDIKAVGISSGNDATYDLLGRRQQQSSKGICITGKRKQMKQ